MSKAVDSTRNVPNNEVVSIPLNDNQFRNLLDCEGKVKCSRELRIAVYRRGVEPSLRKVVWKHLLNVYPSGLTAQQRIDFMKLKCETYCQMRNLWQSNQNDSTVEQTLHMVCSLLVSVIAYNSLLIAGQERCDANRSLPSLLLWQ